MSGEERAWVPCCPLAHRCRMEGYCLTDEIADLMASPTTAADAEEVDRG